MNIRIVSILGGIALLFSANLVYAGGSPKPVKLSGNFGCTFINTAITFDGGLNFASESTCSGHDTFGIYNAQAIAAYYLPTPPTDCTAPDGSAGVVYTLEFATTSSTYNFSNQQFWAHSFTGSLCSSLTTGANTGSTTYTVDGGTGFFTGATGSATANVTGSYLYAAGAEQTGYFGRSTGTETGTITP
jgi:hypothetical protein